MMTNPIFQFEHIDLEEAVEDMNLSNDNILKGKFSSSSIILRNQNEKQTKLWYKLWKHDIL